MIDWLFWNRTTGRTTVVQFPNATLGVFLAASLLQRLVDRDGSLHDGLRVVSTGDLVWWGVDELIRRGCANRADRAVPSLRVLTPGTR